MTFYSSILKPLIFPDILPRTSTNIDLYLIDGRVITTPSVSFTKSSVTIVENGHLSTYDLAMVYDTTYTSDVIYPALPPGIHTPLRPDPKGWVKANLRAILNIVNENSTKDHAHAIVISVEINEARKSLVLAMTEFWSTLPIFVRQRFLSELWNLYSKLLSLYDLSMEYYRIEMYSSGRSIAYRSRWRSTVEGGLDCTYSQPGDVS